MFIQGAIDFTWAEHHSDLCEVLLADGMKIV